MPLVNGSRVAVIGGGPAGAMFAHFLRDLAAYSGRNLTVHIYDAKDFTVAGPRGCNHCGGIISESLVQHLASEGIVLPDSVIQRGIDAYILHVDAGSVGIATPLQEKRIAATYRGGGPRGAAVGDLYMALIATAKLANADPFDYLNQLQLHVPEIEANPCDWMPWNYRETLAGAAATS